MDGKPLYEYARNGIPLPRPIAARSVTVHALSLIKFAEGTEHDYIYPTAELPEDEKVELAKLQKMVQSGATVIETEKVEEEVAVEDVKPVIEEVVGKSLYICLSSLFTLTNDSRPNFIFI